MNPENETMNDGRFVKSFSAMIALMVVLTIFLVITSVMVGGSIQDKLDAAQQEDIDRVVAERVAPVGQLNVGEVPAQPDAATAETASAPQSGESVYQNACAACHASGVAGAPKLGDAEAWKPRIDKGMEVLVEHAITGFQGESGVMPPKGGNPNLSDEDVEAAVAHMVEAAGGDTGELAAADSGTDQPPAEDSSQPQSQAADASEQAQAPAGDGGQAPLAAGSGETGDQANDAGSDQDSAPAAGSPDVAEAGASPSAETLATGERVYQSLCQACHAAGVAGAPKTGDAGAWAPRVDKGVDTLVNNAINGMQGETGVMPPKGGNPGLSDEEVEAAVRYMLEESR